MKLTDPQYEFDLTNVLLFARAAGVAIALSVAVSVVMVALVIQNVTWEIRLLILGLFVLEGVLVLVKKTSKANRRRDFERAWREGFKHERSGVE